MKNFNKTLKLIIRRVLDQSLMKFYKIYIFMKKMIINFLLMIKLFMKNFLIIINYNKK
jgi:hypothetical protein